METLLKASDIGCAAATGFAGAELVMSGGSITVFFVAYWGLLMVCVGFSVTARLLMRGGDR